MPLSIYLDDSRDADLLIALLQNAGYAVMSPRDAGTHGWSDSDHLEFAAQNGYVLLTADTDDFEDLHDAWQTQRRKHAGMLFVYYENDVTKDMTPHDIVRAIANLLAAGVPVTNEIHRLNHWR